MAKFGKFLLTTAALAGTAAAAYYIYKNKDSIISVTKEDEISDEDYDDFSEASDKAAEEAPHYVPLNNETSSANEVKSTVSDLMKNAAAAVEAVVGNVVEKVEALTEAAAEKAETVTESVVETAEDVAESVAEKAEEVTESVTDKAEDFVEEVEENTENFSILPEQMAVEESVEEFFNDEEN